MRTHTIPLWLVLGLLAVLSLGCSLQDILPTPSPLPPPVQTPLVATTTPAPSPTEPALVPTQTLTPVPSAIPQPTPVQTLQVERNVQYGEAEGVPLLVDVYALAPFDTSGPGRPAVMLIHGGGWAAGSKADLAFFGEELAKRGYVAFAISYRLVSGGQHTFPDQLDDVQRAVRWVRANAGQYGVDPQRVAAMGASAGGHLAALLGVSDTRQNDDPALAAYSSRATCVVDIFGPVDLTVPFPISPSGNTEQTVINFFGQPRDAAPELYRQASPIFWIDAQTSPFLILHGDQDPIVPVDQSRRMAQALLEAGIEVEYLELEGEGHGFIQPENIARYTEAMYAFLDRCLMGIVMPYAYTSSH